MRAQLPPDFERIDHVFTDEHFRITVSSMAAPDAMSLYVLAFALNDATAAVKAHTAEVEKLRKQNRRQTRIMGPLMVLTVLVNGATLAISIGLYQAMSQLGLSVPRLLGL